LPLNNRSQVFEHVQKTGGDWFCLATCWRFHWNPSATFVILLRLLLFYDRNSIASQSQALCNRTLRDSVFLFCYLWNIIRS
jgi:hypothetical protein